LLRIRSGGSRARPGYASGEATIGVPPALGFLSSFGMTAFSEFNLKAVSLNFLHLKETRFLERAHSPLRYGCPSESKRTTYAPRFRKLSYMDPARVQGSTRFGELGA
jgi:hypothetical protein